MDKNFFRHDAWRIFRIMSEFVDGFETMTSIGPSVSVFGSARLSSNSPYYPLAVETARRLSLRGFAIITGGGPGMMEAANLGAHATSGKSCGLGVDLPHEKELNRYVDREWSLRFRYFFVRKVMFLRYAQGFIFFPGGYGSLDELFEALTLLQTSKTKAAPLFLMGTDYWEGLLDWLKTSALKKGCINQEDLRLAKITDDPKLVADTIERYHQERTEKENF